MFILGMISVITVPMIGIFDEHNYELVHDVVAFIFFISTALYGFLLCRILYRHREKFSDKEQTEIKILGTLSFIMLVVVGLFFFSASFLGRYYWLTPVLEWIMVLFYINLFGIMSMTNRFYDSIHLYGKLFSRDN